MEHEIAHIALVVNDYDEAIQFYVGKLNFVLVEDTKLSDTKRWVIISPSGSKGCSVLLAKGVGEEQRSRIGNQAGGRVFLFLKTDDLWRDYNNMISKGIIFTTEPTVHEYGLVAVFKDLYGNLWDLIQYTNKR